MLLDIVHLSALSILIPILLGSIFYRRLTKALKVLFWFIVISGAVEASSMIISLMKLNNIYLFHFYTFFQITLLSVVFYLMCPVKRYRQVVSVVSVGFTAYLLYHLMTADLTLFDTNLKIIETILLLSYSIGYVILALTRSDVPYLEMNPYFLLASGLLVYFLGTLFVFLFSFQLKEIESFLPAWTIHNILNIFLNLVVFSSVLWRSRKV